MSEDLESAARAAYNAWAKLNYDSLCCAIDSEMRALANALAIAPAGREPYGWVIEWSDEEWDRREFLCEHKRALMLAGSDGKVFPLYRRSEPAEAPKGRGGYSPHDLEALKKECRDSERLSGADMATRIRAGGAPPVEAELRQAERRYLNAIYAMDDWRDEADEGASDFHSTEHNHELEVSEALCALLATRTGDQP